MGGVVIPPASVSYHPQGTLKWLHVHCRMNTTMTCTAALLVVLELQLLYFKSLDECTFSCFIGGVGILSLATVTHLC